MLGAVGLAEGHSPNCSRTVVQITREKDFVAKRYMFKYSNTTRRQTEHLCLCGQNFLLLLFFAANSSKNVYGRGM